MELNRGAWCNGDLLFLHVMVQYFHFDVPVVPTKPGDCALECLHEGCPERFNPSGSSFDDNITVLRDKLYSLISRQPEATVKEQWCEQSLRSYLELTPDQQVPIIVELPTAEAYAAYMKKRGRCVSVHGCVHVLFLIILFS
jgi:hypothetical protein